MTSEGFWWINKSFNNTDLQRRENVRISLTFYSCRKQMIYFNFYIKYVLISHHILLTVFLNICFPFYFDILRIKIMSILKIMLRHVHRETVILMLIFLSWNAQVHRITASSAHDFLIISISGWTYISARLMHNI